MKNLLFMFMFSTLIAFILLTINFFFSMIKMKNREKITPFECGFDPITSARMPFSIQFFMITLMFLIFDIEIILIIPIIILMNNFISMFSIITFLFFMMILLLSLWLEWSFNYLTWINLSIS